MDVNSNDEEKDMDKRQVEMSWSSKKGFYFKRLDGDV